MKNSQYTFTSTKWFWPIQIAIGTACIVLSIFIAFSPQLGDYTFLVLAGSGLIILGLERVASGIRSGYSKRSSRIINIGIGVGIVVYVASGFFFPEIATRYLVLF
jgi:hypothetical protein